MPRKCKAELPGTKYGKWTVESIGSVRRRTQFWWCTCECGMRFEVRGSDLRSGKSAKCRQCFILQLRHRALSRVRSIRLNLDFKGIPKCDCIGSRATPSARMCRRHQTLWTKFALSPTDYEEKLQKQGGVCGYCYKPMGSDQNIDHCHATGKVRMIVHTRCNIVIGTLESLELSQVLAYKDLTNRSGLLDALNYKTQSILLGAAI